MARVQLGLVQVMLAVLGLGWFIFGSNAVPLSSWHTCATNSDRLTRHPDLDLAPVARQPAGAVLEVDTGKRFQSIAGFGGAFTEAAAQNFFALAEADQGAVLDRYFGAPFAEGGQGGHGYQLGRIPINSCDFSPAQFSYDDVPGDGPALPHFDHSVAHDSRQVIPFVLKAQARAARAAAAGGPGATPRGPAGALRLFGSPWSPPAWMKNPGGNRPNASSMSGSNEVQGLAADHQADWAVYLRDWVSAFKAKGVDLWGITVQNEAEFAAPWEACVYNASFQARFIGEHLGPTMAAAHPGLKIMAYDHNKDHVHLWARALAASGGVRGAMRYLSGVAFHWYVNGPGCGTGDGSCMREGARHLEAAHTALAQAAAAGVTAGHARAAGEALDEAPEAPFLLASESCNCPGVATGTDGWARGEALMRDSLSDLNHYAVGYVDWNLLVDYRGGPNHLGNYCDANIVADPGHRLTNATAGAGGGAAVVLRPSYWLLGHVARFAPRGSVRLGTSFSGSPGAAVDVAAFAMPNGSTSVVLLNRGNESVRYTLHDKAGGREARLAALPHSAQSFIF
eukprot:g5322.t1